MRNLLILTAAGAATAAYSQAPIVAAQPRTSLERLVRIQDYPASARAAGEQGDTDFTLTVDPGGRVSQCTIARSSGSAALDETTCRLMKSRARFTPARAADGSLRYGAAAGRIAWRIPGAPPPSGSGMIADSASNYPAVTFPVEGPWPKASLASLFSDEDYPASARAARESGRVEFTLGIGISGRVESCVIQRSSGSAALDSATCRLIRARARFVPARDASGNAVPSETQGHILWRLPAAAAPGA